MQIVLHGIAWYCMVLHCTDLMVGEGFSANSTSWYCAVLHGIGLMVGEDHSANSVLANIVLF